jgi:hypothetical protein
MHKGYWWENQKDRDHWEDQGVDLCLGYAVLQCALRDYVSGHLMQPASRHIGVVCKSLQDSEGNMDPRYTTRYYKYYLSVSHDKLSAIQYSMYVDIFSTSY